MPKYSVQARLGLKLAHMPSAAESGAREILAVSEPPIRCTESGSEPPETQSVPFSIGAISYLNTMPFFAGWENRERYPLSFGTPREINHLLEDGSCVAGPVSAAYALSSSRPLSLLPFVVACENRIDSVRLVKGLKCTTYRYRLSPHSETGNLLAQILHKNPPDMPPIQWLKDECRDSTIDGWVEIGDQALKNSIPEGFEELDLGEAWRQATCTPPVFALWAVRNDLASPLQIEEIKEAIERSLQEYQQNQERYDREAAKKLGLSFKRVRAYLQNISRNLSPDHMRSIKILALLGCQADLLPLESLKRVEAWEKVVTSQ